MYVCMYVCMYVMGMESWGSNFRQWSEMHRFLFCEAFLDPCLDVLGDLVKKRVWITLIAIGGWAISDRVRHIDEYG